MKEQFKEAINSANFDGEFDTDIAYELVEKLNDRYASGYLAAMLEYAHITDYKLSLLEWAEWDIWK